MDVFVEGYRDVFTPVLKTDLSCSLPRWLKLDTELDTEVSCMRQSRAVELSAGMFVLLGFAALWFLVTQITNRETDVSKGAYEVVAKYENIGSLKVGAPVSMAGVTIGRVDAISFDQNIYKAVVKMRINPQFDKLPEDSDASIMTAGLLGGQYVGVTAGGSDVYMKNGAQFTLVQDAFVLEKLVNQLVATFMSKKDDTNADAKK
jgi:phospholipid/cholesterol/gamma-HCH transport system substrate-binding protein